MLLSQVLAILYYSTVTGSLLASWEACRSVGFGFESGLALGLGSGLALGLGLGLALAGVVGGVQVSSRNSASDLPPSALS